MLKAKFIAAWSDRGYKTLEYLYRGYSYTVQDFGMLGFSLASQHRQEQNRIDRIIEQEELAKTHQPLKTALEEWDEILSEE